MKIDLLGGHYQNRAPLGGNQRQLNLYVEAIPPQQGEPHKAVYQPTPGMIRRSTAPNNEVIRGLYKGSNDVLYACAGKTLYRITKDLTFLPLGDMQVWDGYPYGPVKFADNGQVVFAVDGSEHGYYWDMTETAHRSFKHLEPGGTYPDHADIPVQWKGSNYIDYTDTYFIVAAPNTGEFYTSYSGEVEFGADWVAKKSTTFDDPIQAAVVLRRNIWLIGRYNTEIWYDSGGTTGVTGEFPFEIVSGATGNIEFGCAAIYSIAQGQASIFWLGQSRYGGLQILQGYGGYNYKRISNFGLEAEINSYSKYEDARGFVYNQEGHSFYVLSFPSAEKTWVYDILDESWHERCSLDPTGKERAWRGAFHAHAYGSNFVSDAWSGGLMELDLDTHVEDGSTPIKRIRSFPTVQDTDNENRLSFKSFTASMDVGFDSDPTTTAPLVSLRWSDTRGQTWSNQLEQSIGNIGQFNTSVSWNRLGMSRHRIFELEWTSPIKTSLTGAYVEVTKANS